MWTDTKRVSNHININRKKEESHINPQVVNLITCKIATDRNNKHIIWFNNVVENPNTQRRTWGGETQPLEIIYQQNAHENNTKEPHTKPQNHTFNHSAKHRNNIWLMHFVEENIKTTETNVGGKHSPERSFTIEMHTNESSKEKPHTSSPNHTLNHSPKHRNNIFLMTFVVTNIKPNGENMGTKEHPLEVICNRNVDEKIKQKPHT